MMESSLDVKDAVSPSSVNKAGFQIRSNPSHQQQAQNLRNSGGFRRSSINVDEKNKISINQQKPQNDGRNYEDLMEKLVRSRELDNKITA
jgi:hypothetical protein